MLENHLLALDDGPFALNCMMVKGFPSTACIGIDGGMLINTNTLIIHYSTLNNTRNSISGCFAGGTVIYIV